MTIAVVGSSPKVSGRRMASPAEGPRPGMAPTNMPTSTPTHRNSRVVGDSTPRMPFTRLAKMSIQGSESLGGLGVAVELEGGRDHGGAAGGGLRKAPPAAGTAASAAPGGPNRPARAGPPSRTAGFRAEAAR